MSIVCPLCLEEYKNNINSEKTPRVLSCGDTFCTECLRKLIKDHVIICPLCKKENLEEIEKYSVNRFIFDLINEEKLSVKKEENPDYKFSIALVGDSFAGKTSIGDFFQTGKFNAYPATGFHIPNKYLYVHQKTIQITLWDTVGEEQYRSMTIGYLRRVDALIIV